MLEKYKRQMSEGCGGRTMKFKTVKTEAGGNISSKVF